jgi:hypothetical protein
MEWPHSKSLEPCFITEVERTFCGLLPHMHTAKDIKTECFVKYLDREMAPKWESQRRETRLRTDVPRPLNVYARPALGSNHWVRLTIPITSHSSPHCSATYCEYP